MMVFMGGSRQVVGRLGRWGLLVAAVAPALTVRAAPPPDFDRVIRPLLARRCLVCHGFDASTREAGLRLDERVSATGPTRGGGPPAIVPGDPDASLLVQRVESVDPSFRMPPAPEHDALTPEEVTLVRDWIAAGASYTPPWAWQPIRRRPAPATLDASWPRDDVDRWILAALETRELAPASPADPAVLVRRLSFDLIGLPPAPETVAEFIATPSEAAYRAEVDRLLASPHYGERWARHWLDLVRYAETHGHEFDYPIKYAWQYRDYVVRAFNADVPYDDLLREHIAGDLLERPRRHPESGFNESIIATGFWHLGQGTHAPVDVRADEAERVANQIDVFGKAFLGLTVACARCHDHKFDPITTADYYGLAGFLQGTRRQEAFLDPGGRIAASLPALRMHARTRRAWLNEQMAAWEPAEVTHYLDAAIEVRSGVPLATDRAATPTFVLFEDFDPGSGYDGWTTEGTAFGDGPQTAATIRAYQGDVGAHGVGFVNSHQGRRPPPEGVPANPDGHVGSLTSPPFRIEHRFIHFLIGGGDHAERTCVNLLVDDAVVRTATGRRSNRMHRARFDVREHIGATARIEVVDQETGGWGHVALDHIVFSDEPAWRSPDTRPIATVVAERNCSPTRLARWVRAIADDGRRPAALVGDREPGDPGVLPGAEMFEDFSANTYDGWFVTGVAFGAGPTTAGATRASESFPVPIAAGVAHSGHLASQLQGALRSATFELTHDFIHYHAAGRGGRVRLVIDGYFLDEYNPLLFPGMTLSVDTAARGRRYQWLRQDVSRYRGHRAHIELLDEGDGFLAVDAIVLSASEAAPSRPPDGSLVDGATAARRVTESRDAWAAGTLDAAGAELLSWLLERNLPSPPAAAHDRRRTESRAAFVKTSEAIPTPMRVLASADGTGEDEYVFVRGRHADAGPIVPRRFLASIGGDTQPLITEGSGRAELATRLLDPSNPFVARVIVNRVWQHLFGVGLVPTPDDFGALGTVPTHPELLDELAGWFRDEAGWSIKRLVRRLVTTATYRQSSVPPDAEAAERDPANDWLHHARRRRLEGEAIRDAMLAVSGGLDRTLGGPPVPIHLTEFMTGRGRPGQSGPLDGAGRRSIYQEVRRNFLAPMMLAFDAPVPDSTIGRRTVSNVPAQALMLLNDPFVIARARAWAVRELAERDRTPEQRLERMYMTALARRPSVSERAAGLAFIRARAEENGSPDGTEDVDAWAAFAHVLFNVKEFIFVR
ncbi:MAG: DUF1553 domain-containing protein [Phycisphaerales bacterium]|nr:DUF1553 domain-containing protein [Phycisphaerales bacterium]